MMLSSKPNDKNISEIKKVIRSLDFYRVFNSAACIPLFVVFGVYSTLSPALRKIVQKGISVLWTKRSFPSSPCINPYPFRTLYHLTIPFIVLPSLKIRLQF